jgi:hypothetical protein
MSLLYCKVSDVDHIKYSAALQTNAVGYMQEILYILRSKKMHLPSRYKYYRDVVNEAIGLTPKVAGTASLQFENFYSFQMPFRSCGDSLWYNRLSKKDRLTPSLLPIIFLNT